MKKRLLVLLVLAAIVLTTLGSASALASSPRKATGGAHWTMPFVGIPPEYDPMGYNLAMFNVKELSPGGPVKGWYRWNGYHEALGWMKLVADVKCATFGSAGDYPTVTFVAQITKMTPEEIPPASLSEYWFTPGHWVKIHALDAGSPGSTGDVIGFWGDWTGLKGAAFGYNPGCDPNQPGVLAFPVQGGNFVIHD